MERRQLIGGLGITLIGVGTAVLFDLIAVDADGTRRAVAIGLIVAGFLMLGWALLFSPKREATLSGSDYSITTGAIRGDGNRVGHDIYQGPPRVSNGLYQGAEKIGKVDYAAFDEGTGTVTVCGVHLTDYPNPSQPIELQGRLVVLKLPLPERWAGSSSSFSMMLVGTFKGKVIGRK